MMRDGNILARGEEPFQPDERTVISAEHPRARGGTSGR